MIITLRIIIAIVQINRRNQKNNLRNQKYTLKEIVEDQDAINKRQQLKEIVANLDKIRKENWELLQTQLRTEILLEKIEERI